MMLARTLHVLVLSAGIGLSAAGIQEAESIHIRAARGPMDCKNIKAGSYTLYVRRRAMASFATEADPSFPHSDLSPIKFPVTIEDREVTPPSVTKTSVSIDLCAPLSRENGGDEECPKGTRICMRVINDKKGEGERVTQVIPVGGNEADESDWSTSLGERLDGAERTLRLEMYGTDYSEQKQRTEIDLKCDKHGAKDSKPVLKRYDRLEGKLKLEWSTPSACATHMGGAGDKDDSDGQHSGDGNLPADAKGGWGLFSWFFFFVIVGTIVYFAAGLWRNYVGIPGQRPPLCTLTDGRMPCRMSMASSSCRTKTFGQWDIRSPPFGFVLNSISLSLQA